MSSTLSAGLDRFPGAELIGMSAYERVYEGDGGGACFGDVLLHGADHAVQGCRLCHYPCFSEADVDLGPTFA